MKNFNIYIEGELPDNCKTCQYKSIGRCVLSDENVFDYMVYETSPKECPVKPLSVRLAEERKKLIERIRDLAEIYTEPSAKGFDFETYILTEENLNKILDKVERWGEQL